MVDEGQRTTVELTTELYAECRLEDEQLVTCTLPAIVSVCPKTGKDIILLHPELRFGRRRRVGAYCLSTQPGTVAARPSGEYVCKLSWWPEPRRISVVTFLRVQADLRQLRCSLVVRDVAKQSAGHRYYQVARMLEHI